MTSDQDFNFAPNLNMTNFQHQHLYFWKKVSVQEKKFKDKNLRGGAITPCPPPPYHNATAQVHGKKLTNAATPMKT